MALMVRNHPSYPHQSVKSVVKKTVVIGTAGNVALVKVRPVVHSPAMRHLFLFLVLVLATAVRGADAPPLTELLRRTIDEQGVPAAEKQLNELQVGKFASVAVDEGKLNQLGYHYLQSGKIPEAVLVLQWYVNLFPNSGNSYDSYGEALVAKGDRDGAIAAYEKSLALDPKNRNAATMLAEIKSRPDSIPLMQERMRFDVALNAAFEAQSKEQTVDLAGLRQQLHALLDKNSTDAAAGLVNNFLYLSEAVDLKGAVEDWKYFAQSSNPKIRSLGESKKGLIAALNAPMELKFKAIDGSEVDVAQLRGKVVLVDFWATWCGPCIAEIPNLVANYDKYHGKGFEVVGISFDQAPDAAKPAKRQKTAEQVAEFTKAKNMPWPQYYDGLYWDNVYGKQYGIRAIPAMFLIDKNGMLVSTNARGPKLERELKRLLGL